MNVSETATDEQTAVQARIAVSLSYVQTLRRETEAGRVSLTMLDDYLERLEGHLRKMECSPAIAADVNDRTVDDGASFVDDMLILEHFARP